jgi:O-acetylserine/cysteine efflux transporter
LGIFIAFVGLGIMGHEAQGGVAFSGMLMILLSAMFWGLSNIFYKKVGRVDMFTLIVWSGAVSVPFFAVASWCYEGIPVYTHMWEVFDYKLLGMVIYVSFVATWYGSTALGFLLNRYNPATVAPYTLLVSVFAILMGYLVLDERLSMQSSTACVIVILGLCINQIPGHIDILQLFKNPFRKPEIV